MPSIEATPKSRLERFARWATEKWRSALFVAGAITLVSAIGMAFLEFDLTFYSIMPKNSRATEDLAEIVDHFPSASMIVTVVTADPVTVVDAADAVAEAYRAGSYADRLAHIEARFDESYFLEHGLMLLPESQLRRLRLLLAATAARTARNAAANPAASGRAATSPSSASNLETLDLAAVLRLFGSGSWSTSGDGNVYLSDDGDRALVFVQPRFTINDIGVYAKVIPEMEADAKAAAARFGAEAGLTGLVVVAKDEMKTSEQGLEMSMGIAVALILVLLITSYRMWSVPLIVGAPLVLGVLWTAGLTGFVQGRLNIMTAMYLVALIGLGVDYAIHLLTSYRQSRSVGVDRIESIVRGVTVTGPGIIVGALTTAVAFFALVVAESSLIRELGIVAGMGILCELAAMLLLVPALLARRAERIERRGKRPSVLDRIPMAPVGSPGGTADAGSPRTATILIVLVVAAGVTIALGSQAGRVEVETNLMNMEAKGLESVELQDVMVEAFGMAPDGLSVIAVDPEEAARLTAALEELSTVSAVDSIAYFLPSREAQESRAKEIAAIATVLDSILEREQSPLAPLARALLPLTESPFITVDDLPEHIRDMYLDDSGKRNLVTIVPTENLWVRENRDAFTAEIETVTDRATGMVLAADQMTNIAERDGVTAAIAALVAIFIILLIDFRNFVTAILTLIPLGCSFLALFGIMATAGIKFDFINIISVPLLIGIGIDDAVHMSHRYLHEGIGSIRRVVTLTGTAILLTSLTTMIGFGSFIPSIMRAMRSTGIVLTIAMALALVYSVTLHPVLLYLVRERLGIRLEAYDFKKRVR